MNIADDIKKSYARVIEYQDEAITSCILEDVQRAESMMRFELEQLGNLINKL